MVFNYSNPEYFPVRIDAVHKYLCLGLATLLLLFSWYSDAGAETSPATRPHKPVLELDPSRPLISLDRPPSARVTRNGERGTRDTGNGPARPVSPPDSFSQPSYSPDNSDVESGDLAPVTDQDGSGLPIGVWQGLDARSLEALFSKIDLPPRSPVLNDLWGRFLLSKDSFGQNLPDPNFQILKLEALFRSGRFDDLLQANAFKRAPEPSRTMGAIIQAKALLGLGRDDEACTVLKDTAGSAVSSSEEVPKTLRLQSVKINIYCRAAKGSYPAANLAIELARDLGLDTPFAFKVVTALEAGRHRPKPPAGKLKLVDYKFMALFKNPIPARLIKHASAPVLSAMLANQNMTMETRLEIAERAFRQNIIPARRLAAIYTSAEFAQGELENPMGAYSKYRKRAHGRALLYRALENERDPVRAARLARALMTSSKSAGLYLHMPYLLGRYIDRLPQTGDLAWFAETATEIALASGNYEKALSWAVYGTADISGRPRKLLNWLTLIDISAPDNTVPRGAGLSTTEEAALAGQFSSDNLHRLVTILDALKYDVPVRLWDRASRAPQPTSGHLPETGLLSKLERAAKEQKYGKVILFSIIALGREGPPNAHIIALGDTIRAMSAIGLNNEARRVALEALYSVWPRQVSN